MWHLLVINTRFMVVIITKQYYKCAASLFQRVPAFLGLISSYSDQQPTSRIDFKLFINVTFKKDDKQKITAWQK